MAGKVIWLMVIILVAACATWINPAPSRFSQFAERSIAGPGTFAIPQWSPDGRFIAFIDTSGHGELLAYDLETETGWQVASDVSSRHFSWSPDGNLTYLKYRPELSGSPDPAIFDLHQVDLRGETDRVIVSSLTDPVDFDWFHNGIQLAILLWDQGVYVLNPSSGASDLLLTADAMGMDQIGSIALSSDQSTMLIYGIRGQNNALAAQMVIYDLQKQLIRDRIFPSQVITQSDTAYPWAGIGDSTSSDWVAGDRWFLTSSISSSGACYNYALFFFDLGDVSNSFCVPTIEGIVADPSISPDLARIGYLTLVGANTYYVTISDIPAEVRVRLNQ